MLQTAPVQELSETPMVLRCATADPDALRSAIGMFVDAGMQSILILATAADRWDPAVINPVLSDCPVTIFGGVFPAVFSNTELFDEGTVLVGLTQNVRTQLISNISGDRDDLLERLESGSIAASDDASVLVFVDSRRANAEFLVDSLYDVFGDSVSVSGGGVGSLTERILPCVITNSGLETDAAVLVGFQEPAIQAFEHGWATLEGPHVITSAEGTLLKTINHQPAAEVYMNAIEEATDWRFEAEEFRKISSLYPIGIEQTTGPYLVRDPMAVDGDALICVGEVPNGAVVQILQGNKDGLVNAAGQVARTVINGRLKERSSDPKTVFAWDCASRRKYLLDDFQEELDAISKEIPEQDQLIGAMTVAEVASTANGTIRLLNKSLVMMCP